MSSEAQATSSALIIKVLFGAFALMILYFLYDDAWPFITADESGLGFYAQNFGAIKIHVVGGTIMLALGLHQIASGWLDIGFKNHKLVGYVYLAALLAGLTGYWGLIGTTQPLSFAYNLSVLAILWAVTGAMAYWAIRKRNIVQHREWMMRNYAATLGFIALRIFIEDPEFKAKFEGADYLAGATGIAIVLPWLIVETLMHGAKIIRDGK